MLVSVEEVRCGAEAPGRLRRRSFSHWRWICGVASLTAPVRSHCEPAGRPMCPCERIKVKVLKEAA